MHAAEARRAGTAARPTAIPSRISLGRIHLRAPGGRRQRKSVVLVGAAGEHSLRRGLRPGVRVVEALGDLCSIWVTFNEPNVYSGLGYVLGEFPPGRTGDLRGAIRALSGMGAAHARAYRAIHELQPDAHVGFAHNYLVFHPAR